MSQTNIIKENFPWIKGYIDLFCEIWSPYLKENEVMNHDLHLNGSGNICVIMARFLIKDKNGNESVKPKANNFHKIAHHIFKLFIAIKAIKCLIFDRPLYLIRKDRVMVMKFGIKPRLWGPAAAADDAIKTINRHKRGKKKNVS